MKISTLMFALSLIATTAIAQPHPDGPPPKEAIEACEEKTKDATCEFKGKKGEVVKGTCFTPDVTRPLACKPKVSKFNEYLDYEEPSLTKEFSNCNKDASSEITCPEGTYKFIGGKTGDKIQDGFKRDSKEKVFPDTNSEVMPAAVQK